MKDKKIDNIAIIILSIIIVTLTGIFIYINLIQYRAGLNADIASEGVLAREIWVSKQWFPDDWYFSTEARLISVPNIAAFFYGMTGSICTAMGLGCIVAGIFELFSLYYVGKAMEFTCVQKLILIGMVMLLPNNKNMVELMFIFADHYAFHTGVCFLTMGLYYKMIKHTKAGNVEKILIAILHLILGIQGLRGIQMITGPLLAVEVLRCIYILWKDKKWNAVDKKSLGFVLILNVLEFIGSKLPLSVGLTLSTNIRKGPQKLVEEVLPVFMDVFYWNKLTLVDKVVFASALMMVVGLTINILWRGVGKKGIKEEEWLFLTFPISIIMTMLILAFTTSLVPSRYFLAIIFAIAVACAILWKKSRPTIKVLFLLSFLLVFNGNWDRLYYPTITDKRFEDNVYVQIGDYLYEEGYKNAYASFEHANTITVANDGKVQVSAVFSFENMEVYRWLSSKRWYVPNVPKDSKTAYVVSKYKLEELEKFLNENKEAMELKTQIGDFYIYGSEYNYTKLRD